MHIQPNDQVSFSNKCKGPDRDMGNAFGIRNSNSMYSCEFYGQSYGQIFDQVLKVSIGYTRNTNEIDEINKAAHWGLRRANFLFQWKIQVFYVKNLGRFTHYIHQSRRFFSTVVVFVIYHGYIGCHQTIKSTNDVHKNDFLTNGEQVRRTRFLVSIWFDNEDFWNQKLVCSIGQTSKC